MASELSRVPAYRHTMQRLEEVKRVNSQGDDYWVGREIYAILGYAEWDSFRPVIERAEAAIQAGGGDSSQHIGHTSKMVEVGSGAKRRVGEVFLSRGACYLIAMNGDPTKPEIAGAQQYFAIQARSAELAENEAADRKRLKLRDGVTEAAKRVGDAAKDAGVQRYGIFHDARWRGLYGMAGKDVEKVKGVPDGAHLFDHAGELELSAHEFQMQLARAKLVNEQISNEGRAVKANLEVAQEVRSAIIAQSGVRLEDIPLEREPIAEVRKRLSPRVRALRKPDQK